MTETCPICDSMHATIDGVIMHMRNMGDEQHREINNQYQAVERIQASENAVQESSTDTQDDSSSTSDDTESTTSDSTESSTPDTTDSSTKGSTSGSTTDDSTMFDEPDAPAVKTAHINLPCGHESIDPDDMPDRPQDVTCTICGEKWGFKP